MSTRNVVPLAAPPEPGAAGPDVRATAGEAPDGAAAPPGGAAPVVPGPRSPAVEVPVAAEAPTEDIGDAGTAPVAFLRRGSTGGPRSRSAEGDHERRLARSADVLTVGCFVLVVTASLALAGYGGPGDADPVWLAAAACVAAAAGLVLARVGGAGRARRSPRQRVLAGCVLLTGLAADAAVVSAAGGLETPVWVAFLPMLLLAAAVLATEAAVGVGALAAGALYLGAAAGGDLDPDTTARLVVLLPLFPALAYAASTTGAHLRRAAREAAGEQARLDADLRRLESEVHRLAGGDLTVTPSVDPGAHPTATALAVALADTVVALRRVARSVDDAATRVRDDSRQLLASTDDLADSALHQDAAVAQVTATVAELAATSAHIATTAGAVSQYAEQTLRDATHADATVAATVEALAAIERRVTGIASRVDALSGSADRIRALLRGIDDLARATNMLALNAAIEAARAAAAGPGFTVVAGEIAKLAQRARVEAMRITAIVDDMAAETERTREATLDGLAGVRSGRQRAEEVVRALARIGAMVTRTTAAASEISVATRQQRSASEPVVASMGLVTRASTRYAAGAQRTRAAAAELATLSEEMAHRVHVLSDGRAPTFRGRPRPALPGSDRDG